jgi:hypothetical protein
MLEVDWLDPADPLNMKTQIKYSVIVVVLLGTGSWLLTLLNAHATTIPQTILRVAPAPAPVIAAPIIAVPVIVPPAANPGVLDPQRRFALGMIETGNRDSEIGGAGEVSRYQIMPSVWKQYSDSRSYQNPDTSLEVAQQHWSANYARFKQQAHRAPTDFDMYVLWNTRYGYYAKRGFNPANLAPVVRERAQRFVNLVESYGVEFASNTR